MRVSAQHTKIHWMIGILCSVLLGIPTVLAVTTQEEFDAARAEFDAAWQEASEQTRRTTQLEQNLHYYDQKVAEAREKSHNLALEQRDVRFEIASRTELITALTNQIEALHAYGSDQKVIFEEQKDEFVSFLRYVALQDTVINDAGPVIGGAVMRRLQHGSLGEVLEQDLYNDALQTARTEFIGRLERSEQEASAAKERLQEVAEELTQELQELNGMREELDSEYDEINQEFAARLHTRELTRSELDQIRQTVAETNQRVFAIQQNLSAYNKQLIEHQEKKFAIQIASLEEQLQSRSEEEATLASQKENYLAIKRSAKDAYDNAQSQIDSDPRQYRRLTEAKEELSVKRERLERLQSLEELDEFATQKDREKHRDQLRERDRLPGEIATLERKISFLEDGWPEPLIDPYLTKFAAAQKAEASLKALEYEDQKLTETVASLKEKLAAVIKERDEAKERVRNDLPQVLTAFSWPVHGTITAGFLDSGYERFFGVPHRAIDIAVAQGSPVHSIADGVIYTVKDGGAKGFSYVLIGHRDGYTSLYGHMLQMYVSEGDIVEQGQVIGLSGGQPGTNGAGLMTTGPHVHLEVHKNGKAINPLSVLGK